MCLYAFSGEGVLEIVRAVEVYSPESNGQAKVQVDLLIRNTIGTNLGGFYLLLPTSALECSAREGHPAVINLREDVVKLAQSSLTQPGHADNWLYRTISTDFSLALQDGSLVLREPVVGAEDDQEQALAGDVPSEAKLDPNGFTQGQYYGLEGIGVTLLRVWLASGWALGTNRWFRVQFRVQPISGPIGWFERKRAIAVGDCRNAYAVRGPFDLRDSTVKDLRSAKAKVEKKSRARAPVTQDLAALEKLIKRPAIIGEWTIWVAPGRHVEITDVPVVEGCVAFDRASRELLVGTVMEPLGAVIRPRKAEVFVFQLNGRTDTPKFQARVQTRSTRHILATVAWGGLAVGVVSFLAWLIDRVL